MGFGNRRVLYRTFKDPLSGIITTLLHNKNDSISSFLTLALVAVQRYNVTNLKNKEVTDMTRIFTAEEKKAWDEVLFWAKRLSYKSADQHPEWRERYEAAKADKNRLMEAKRVARVGR